MTSGKSIVSLFARHPGHDTSSTHLQVAETIGISLSGEMTVNMVLHNYMDVASLTDNPDNKRLPLVESRLELIPTTFAGHKRQPNGLDVETWCFMLYINHLFVWPRLSWIIAE